MKKLRILQLVDTLDAGGMEAQLVALMNRLDPDAFEFRVVCLRHEGLSATRLRSDITVTALHKEEGFQLNVVKRLRTILMEQWDLVHTHNWAPLVYAALATHGGHMAPILHGEHSQLNTTERGWKKLWLRRLFYRTCAGVHTVSAGQREELLAFGLTHQRMIALINGVDTKRFQPGPKTKQKRVIGIVARFGSFKRHADLVQAFEQVALTYPDLHLLMVGDGGPEKEAVERKLKTSSVRERITLAGYQSDPVPWYQKMDLLAVPSCNEGLSNATLEAMACGVPVLSNAICGARELLGQDEGGWVCDLSNVEKLTNELLKILALPIDVWQAQGRLGRERAIRFFSWDRMAMDYAQTFSDCAKDQR